MSPAPDPSPVRWAELRPDGFRARRASCPVVYLPLGLCEPHGHVAALGLDLIKAEHYCEESARRFGGVVAPAQGYHIHECGFHAPWLAEVVGEENPLLTALPPHVLLHGFLYQLRAFARAEFRAVVAISGHSGGSQEDLRRAAAAFTGRFGLPVVVRSDPEWIPHLHVGDHAGRYEISQLLDIRPDLVDLRLLRRRFEPGSGGRLALGEDAGEATAEYGRTLNEAIVAAVGETVGELMKSPVPAVPAGELTYDATEDLWESLRRTGAEWRSVAPDPGQHAVPSGSRWYPYQHPTESSFRPTAPPPPSRP